VSLFIVCRLPRTPREAREKPSVTCLPPPPVAAAASDEPSLLPPPSSRPLRSRSEVRRQLAATLVVARRFGSTQGARRPLANLPSPPPLCRARAPCRCASAHHARALAGAQSAMRRIVAADHQLGLALQVALYVQYRRLPSPTSAFSRSPRPSP